MGLLDDFTEEEIAEEEEVKEIPKEEEEEEKGISLVCDPNKKSIPTREKTTYKVKLINTTDSEQEIDLEVHLLYSTDSEEIIPWNIDILDQHRISEPSDTLRETIEVKAGDETIIPVKVSAPEGADYGDKAEVVIDASSSKDVLLSDSITLITTARPTVVAMKTQINQERSVADYIASWAKDKDMGVFSILVPKPVRGYIFIEAMNPSIVDEVCDGTRKAKGIIDGDTSIEEIEHFLAPKLAVEGITEGDIVELSAGPFKGEKARVTQIDEDNDEITVELFEATVPIPVTVRGDHVRVLEKEK
ncbi:MAG: transcription elongation factor Spt5 [Candidatus Thermoplasmatota archaeon]